MRLRLRLRRRLRHPAGVMCPLARAKPHRVTRRLPTPALTPSSPSPGAERGAIDTRTVVTWLTGNITAASRPEPGPGRP